MATVENILLTFVLLNGGAPHFFRLSIEQKEYCLQNFTGVLVITKDEVICSANKLLGKLVNVYVMLLIENKNRKQKRNKRKKSLPC